MPTISELIAQATSQSELATLLASDKFGIYPAKAYLVGDGVTDDYTALYNLINTTINGAEAEIWFAESVYLIGSNITIPSNIKLKFLNGAMLKPGSGITITGNNTKIEAGLHKIFDISVGTISGKFIYESIYPQWFGAFADGLNDDIAAIRAAINVIASSGEGGVLTFPNGAYRITDTIRITTRSVCLRGMSRRTGDVFDNIASGNGAAVIIPDTTASPAILLDSEYEVNGFSMEDIAIARNISISETRTGTGIEFHLKNSASNFVYDFYCNRIAIVNMDKCFYQNRESSATQTVCGKFVCTNGFFLFNNQVHEHSNFASWNVFTFVDNYASSNSVLPFVSGSYTYAERNTLHVSCVCGTITGNIMESNPNPIVVNNLYLGTTLNPWIKTGLVIENNYFEINYGNALIRLNGCSGFHIGNNWHEDSPAPTGKDLTYKVNLDNCKSGKCLMDGVFQIASVDIDNTQTTPTETQVDTEGTYSYFAIGEEYLLEISEPNVYGFSNGYSTASFRTDYPHFGQGGSNSHSITGSTSKDFTLTVDMKADSGDWLVVTIPLMFNEKTSFPRFDLILNGDAINVNDSKRYDFLTGAIESKKWYLFTIAKKLTSTITTAVLKFYPYAGSSGSKLSYFIEPTLYSTSSMRNVKPWLNKSSIKFSAAPLAGTWKAGDIIINSAPTAGGYSGWICVSGGTPGTWKGYGLIEA